MNKRLLSAVMLSIIAAACTEKEKFIPPELSVSREIPFRVAQAVDYSAPVYDGIQAEVRLSVAKENLQNGTTTVLWDTTFSMRNLRLYPAFNAPLNILKQFGGIVETRESLRVSRIIRYSNSNNQTWMDAIGESVPLLTPLKRFDVSL